MQRRLAERVREADLDSKDRNKEQEELDELKNKIFAGEYDNPTAEFEKVGRLFCSINQFSYQHFFKNSRKRRNAKKCTDPRS